LPDSDSFKSYWIHLALLLMQQLNIPPVKVDTRIIDGKYQIFDAIRKKYLLLTPEEWVRQHIIQYLLDHHNYAKGLISVEGGMKYNQLLKRTDVLVHDHHGKPYLLIECKSFDVTLSNKAVEQAAVYNKKIRAPYVLITNGLQHYCCYLNNRKSRYEKYEDIPPAPKDEGAK
jgi:hypothetical protein